MHMFSPVLTGAPPDENTQPRAAEMPYSDVLTVLIVLTTSPVTHARARVCVCGVGENSENTENIVSISLNHRLFRVLTCVLTAERTENITPPCTLGATLGQPGQPICTLHPWTTPGNKDAASRRSSASLRSASRRSPTDVGVDWCVQPGCAVDELTHFPPIPAILWARDTPGGSRGSSPEPSSDRSAPSTNIFVCAVGQSRCASTVPTQGVLRFATCGRGYGR